jgi:non-ribosomal peptide synthetase component F
MFILSGLRKKVVGQKLSLCGNDGTAVGMYTPLGATPRFDPAGCNSHRTKSQQITYRELNELTNKFAMSLRRVGVQRGALVVVFMNRSSECLAALLGIWLGPRAFESVGSSGQVRRPEGG